MRQSTRCTRLQASLDLPNMAAALTCLSNGSTQSIRRLCQHVYGSNSLHYHVLSRVIKKKKYAMRETISNISYSSILISFPRNLLTITDKRVVLSSTDKADKRSNLAIGVARVSALRCKPRDRCGSGVRAFLHRAGTDRRADGRTLGGINPPALILSPC